MMTDDTGAPTGATPKLSIGQRLLTALPNLQRQPKPVPTRPSKRGPAPTASSGDTSGSSGATSGTATSDDDTDASDRAVETTTNGASTSVGGRLRDALVKPPPAGNRTRGGEDLDAMSREEIAHRIKKLDDRERFLALTAAPIGVAVGILLTTITLHLNPAHYVHGKLNPKYASESVILLEGGARILLSGLVAATAMSRRRSLVGFSLLFLGTSMGSPLFALPFWGLGGYLIWRVFKYQRALTAKGGAPGRARTRPDAGAAAARAGGRVPASPRGAGRAGAAAARERVRSQRGRGRKEPAPKGPTPSKRYTPPRPTRPRPPAAPS